ncbi:MAG TPA: FecR domain-containing protein [Rhizomicrobium sp.]|nr:FecR domain-containing protein [Rhizomicrobium sp.]
MSDNTPSKAENNAAAIEERAADWLQRRRYWKEWSEADQKALDAWLAESMSHAVAFWRLEATLDRTERLSALRPLRLKRPLNEVPKRLPGTLRFAAVFGALTVAAVVGYSTWHSLPQPVGQLYSTGLGGRATVQLTDGSSIELNTNTAIRADVRAGKRYVSIEKGEAYFDIVHDAKSPFIVDVGGHRITDLGTKFVVRDEPGRVEVALLEGRASIASVRPDTQHHEAVLTPGDVAIATADSLSVEQRPKPTLAKELSWRHGLLIFDGAPLSDVAAELNRYSTEKIVVAGDGVGKLTIDASVPTNDIRAFTRVAHEVFGLHVQDRGNEIVISR